MRAPELGLTEALYAKKDLNPIQRLALAYIADNADEAGFCNNLDVEMAAKILETDLVRLHRIHRSLREKGLIEIVGTAFQLYLD